MLNKPVLDVVRENYDQIFSAERKVADFILENPQDAVNATVSELAKLSGVSDATVVRMCNHLGYKGYYQFKLLLAKDIGRSTEFSNDSNEIVKVFSEYASDIAAIGENIDVELMKKCIDLTIECNQAHIIAVGNTTPLALYMGFRLGRIGVNCTYSIGPEYFLNNINLAGKDDIIIAITHSGSSNQIIQGVKLGKEKGLKIIVITSYKNSPVAEMADYSLISCVKPEEFNFRKDYAHLYETAVIDGFLHLATNFKKIQETDADKPEVILSEYKL